MLRVLTRVVLLCSLLTFYACPAGAGPSGPSAQGGDHDIPQARIIPEGHHQGELWEMGVPEGLLPGVVGQGFDLMGDEVLLSLLMWLQAF
jgi:hypothetical protein